MSSILQKFGLDTLSPEDRLAVAQALWESVKAGQNGEVEPPELRAELERRASLADADAVRDNTREAVRGAAMMRPDVLVLDAAERPLMLVEVRDRVLEPDLADRLRDFMAAEQTHGAPFGMIVDLETIRIFAFSPEKTATTLATLPTADAFSFYRPEFARMTIYHAYLSALTEAWLRDLAYHWKSQSPPGQELFDKLGVLSRLKDGWTVAKGSSLNADAVY
jgi:putative addiction module component (TIGR02574 family)